MNNQTDKVFWFCRGCKKFVSEKEVMETYSWFNIWVHRGCPFGSNNEVIRLTSSELEAIVDAYYIEEVLPE